MIKKQYLKSKAVCKVTFTLPENLSVESAFLVGDFNNWDASATPMKKDKGGHYAVTLNLDKDKEYQFRYLINGQEWQNDWNADQYVPNPFSGDNSVVVT